MTGMMDLVLLEIRAKVKVYGFGFFLYNILDRFDEICSQAGKRDYIEKYERIKKELKENLNANAWDGNWFKRAFMDNGMALGCKDNEECRIDSIAQSWSVISNAGDDEKKKQAMDSLEANLIDKNVRNY